MMGGAEQLGLATSRLDGLALSSRAMTLPELLATMAVIAIVLAALVIISDALRVDNSDSRTRHVLRTLRQAMYRYHDVHQAWPPQPTYAAIDAMLKTDASREYVHALSPTTDAQGRPTVLDGYGQPIHYWLPTSDGHAQPDFVSAGPDRRLGDLNVGPADRDVTDNLYGAELEGPRP